MPLVLSEFGSGPRCPLVVLHGLLGAARNWQTLAQRWAVDGRRVVVPDMPNHGASPWTEVMDYPFMARAVVAMIAQSVGEPVALMGHSMGGKAAMMVALTAPQWVDRLIVADAAPVAYEHTFAPYFRAMRAVSLSTAQRRADVDDALSAAIEDPRVRAFLMQNLDGTPGHYRWRANLSVLHAALEDILNFPAVAPGVRYEGPTLFLRGDRSCYVEPEHEARIRALFPKARIETIQDAGHWLHADQPEAFAAAVSAFLES